MSTTMPEFNWSELQRSPVKIEKALAKHESVRLKRRNAAPLLLTKTAAGSELIAIAAHICTGLAGDGAGADLIARVSRMTWPWLEFLSDADRVAFLEEFTRTLAACAAINEFRPLIVLLAQWENTATAIAAGVDLRTPIIDDAGNVPRPRGKRGRKK